MRPIAPSARGSQEPGNAQRCRRPGCGSNELIKAHIVPAGFARTMHRPGGHNLGLGPDGARRARYQLGAFDPAILCGACDRALGELDAFAQALCRSDLPAAKAGTTARIAEIDCDRLAAFVISVVWRASISALPLFADIRLGPLEARAGDIAFGREALAFPVIANRLASTRYDVRDFYIAPVRRRVSGLNAYTMLLGGFQFFMLADGRALPRHLQPLIINGRDVLVSLAVPLEETGEFQGMLEIADRVRRKVRLSPPAAY